MNNEYNYCLYFSLMNSRKKLCDTKTELNSISKDAKQVKVFAVYRVYIIVSYKDITYFMRVENPTEEKRCTEKKSENEINANFHDAVIV